MQMKIETNSRMSAIQLKIRAETGAKVLMEGQYPKDLTPQEQVVAQRLVELWKQGETEAGVHVSWRVDGERIIHTIGIRRADQTIENYGEAEEGKSMPNETSSDQKPDYVNHPPHYATHPSGVECVDIAEHLSFNLGNALKYLWRAKGKGREEEDLQKCLWYLEREVRTNNLMNQVGSVTADIVRLNSQKALDKEGKTSALGKFLMVLVKPSVVDTEDFGELMKIVRSEIKIVKAGDSR